MININHADDWIWTTDSGIASYCSTNWATITSFSIFRLLDVLNLVFSTDKINIVTKDVVKTSNQLFSTEKYFYTNGPWTCLIKLNIPGIIFSLFSSSRYNLEAIWKLQTNGFEPQNRNRLVPTVPQHHSTTYPVRPKLVLPQSWAADRSCRSRRRRRRFSSSRRRRWRRERRASCGFPSCFDLPWRNPSNNSKHSVPEVKEQCRRMYQTFLNVSFSWDGLLPLSTNQLFPINKTLRGIH